MCLVSAALELLAKADIACSFPQLCPTSPRLPPAAHLSWPCCFPLHPCKKTFPSSPREAIPTIVIFVVVVVILGRFECMYPRRRHSISICVSPSRWLKSWEVEPGMGVRPEGWAAAVRMTPLLFHVWGTMLWFSKQCLQSSQQPHCHRWGLCLQTTSKRDCWKWSCSPS